MDIANPAAATLWKSSWWKRGLPFAIQMTVKIGIELTTSDIKVSFVLTFID